MLADVTIDGMVEDEFRQAIETLLREGNADHAAKWLKSRLAPLCGEDLPLPARLLTVAPAEIAVTGWEDLGGRFDQLDASGSRITALAIDLAPDGSGSIAPRIETRFYSDEALPFSRCDRAGLLTGYKGAGAGPWAGSFAEVDGTIGIEGIDDLYGPVQRLAQRRANGDVTDDELRAHMLGAGYIAVLVHLAVRETALRQGVPRPLAVFVGSTGSYPFFDAPVIAAPDAIVASPLPLRPSVQSGESELLEDFDKARQNHPGLSELPQPADPQADAGQEPEAWDAPPPPDHVTGTQLRKRLVTAESIAELEAAKKPSLIQRLFRRN